MIQITPATIIAAYFFVMNALTFFYFGFDKWQSTTPGARRTSERTLWLLALLGGSVGGFAAMHIFRHKTQKDSFQIVMAGITLLQIGLVYLVLKYRLLS